MADNLTDDVSEKIYEKAFKAAMEDMKKRIAEHDGVLTEEEREYVSGIRDSITYMENQLMQAVLTQTSQDSQDFSPQG